MTTDTDVRLDRAFARAKYMAEVDAFAAAIAKRAPLFDEFGDVLAFRQAAEAAVQGDQAAYCAFSAAWTLKRYRGRGSET